MKKMTVFFDHSSTTPLDPRVLDAMMPYLTGEFGNPSSHIHSLGRSALEALTVAREKTANLLNAQKDEIVFTSGATESNNLAIKGLAPGAQAVGRHILISEIEHYSVLNTAGSLKKQGFTVDFIPVDQYGMIKPESLKKCLKPETSIVSIMKANTEIGTIQPIKEAVEIVKSHNDKILFHCDAASAAGWIPIDVKDLGVDTLTVSAHNFYGPKGAGALYVKKGVKIEPIFNGGFQEMGLRSGMENVPALVGMGKAAELARTEMESRNVHLDSLQSALWQGLEQKLKFIHFTGHPQNRLPGHVSFWIEFAEGESILLFLQVNGIMAASGSACSSNMLADDEDELIHSHVLAAVGVPSDICSGSICFFMGKENTMEEVEYVLEKMPGIIEKLWAMSPAYGDMLKEEGII